MNKFPGFYETGDAAYMDEEGYIYIMGRQDSIINVAGHLLCTGGMEEILMTHPAVAECAVIGVNDDLKGQIPIGFVVVKAGSDIDESTLSKDMVELVRKQMGPIACFRKAAVVKQLPKTRSGKILRGTMARIANGQPYKVTPTIEDRSVVDDIQPAIQNAVA